MWKRLLCRRLFRVWSHFIIANQYGTGRSVLGMGTPIYRNGKKCAVLTGYPNVSMVSRHFLAFTITSSANTISSPPTPLTQS